MTRTKKVALCSLLLLQLSACGDDDAPDSTSEVSDNTIEGVCEKLNQLSCAQPNCEEGFTLGHKNCTENGEGELFQDLLDCLAIASFACGGDPYIPRTDDCLELVYSADAACAP